MRFLPFAGIILAGIALGMAACSASNVQTACKLDAAGQPVALTVLSLADPALAPAVQAVDGPIHKAIQDACAPSK